MAGPGQDGGSSDALPGPACARCGQAMPATSRFCPHCGQAVLLEEAPTVFGDGDALTPAGSAGPEEATRFVPADDSLTVAVPVDSGDAMTTAAPSDHALTIAAVSDSLANAMTIASPVTPTARPAGSIRGSRRHSGDSGPLEVGQSFGPRYHIIRLLGAGGMGAVYQAWDAELGVAVAIKVIRPEVMDDPAMAEEVSRRFKRELLLARQVTHKNVVRIHDLGDIDGIKYITMSYVEGTDLSSILKKDGKRPVRDVLRLARSVISGLVAAHAADVVHRDLKPANIMIDKDGEALIMDFGIAHSTSDAGTAPKPGAGLVPEHLSQAAAHHAATTVGSIVGTVEYMAPEQAKGQTIDQRVDVYAFGLILYDALLGRRRASSGAVAVEELQRRMAAPPPPLQALAPDIPAPVAGLVARCVEPEAEKRFQTSAEVAAELDRLDEDGNLIPVKRVIGLPLMVAIVTTLLAAVGGTWWYWQGLLPPPTYEPVRVAIADFENTTGDPAFDQIIEPIVRRGLEDASFITAFDRTRLRSSLGVQLTEKFDKDQAHLIAVNQGLDVVLAGTIARQDRGYTVSVKVTKAAQGELVVETSRRASSKDQVLEETARVIADVRKALGDRTSDEELFAMRTMTATRLDVARYYAAAFDAQANGRTEETITHLQAAIDLDPKTSGLGYQGLAIIARNLDNIDDAKKYIDQALGHLDGMTDREKLATRGVNAIIQGSPERCVAEYGVLLDKYAADAMAHNQRALCLSKLRKLREVPDTATAVGEMRKAVQLLPKRALFRANLAAYAAYGSDFQAAQKEAESVEEPYDYATLALAFSQLGQGALQEATQTYQKLAGMGVRGASWSAAGLGDLAIYQGRYADAVRLLEAGAKADLDSKFPERAARKLLGIAYANLLRGDVRAALEATDRALKMSQSVEVRFLAGRLLVEAGQTVRAEPIAAALVKEVPTEPHAYGRILEGEIALKNGDARRAIALLSEANDQSKGGLDTWIGHFSLARAYQTLDQFVDAESHFDQCIQRRGEALSLLLDEVPTFGYLPVVYYLQGQTREKFNPNGVKAAYDEYMRIRGESTEDRVVRELRRRAK